MTFTGTRPDLAQLPVVPTVAAIGLGTWAAVTLGTTDIGHVWLRALAVASWMAALLVQVRVAWSPALVPVILGVEAFALGGYPDSVAFPILLTLISAALTGSRTTGRAIAVAALAWPVGATLRYVREYPFPSFLQDIGWTTAFAWLALSIGVVVNRARIRRDESARAAAARERHLLEQQSLVKAAERARIASELHDLITHSVVQMCVQAGAAHALLASDEPGRAAEPLWAVERTGSATLVELRRILGVLRETNSDPPVPLPGLRAIIALAHDARRDGMSVAVTLPPATGLGLGLGTELTALRVVESALAQAVLASATTAHIDVRRSEDNLSIRLRHNGSPHNGAPHNGAPHNGAPPAQDELDRSRARTRLYGGKWSARIRDDGEHELLVLLPAGTT